MARRKKTEVTKKIEEVIKEPKKEVKKLKIAVDKYKCIENFCIIAVEITNKGEENTLIEFTKDSIWKLKGKNGNRVILYNTNKTYSIAEKIFEKNFEKV